MRIDYENPEVVARQNIAPNAGCDIDGVFYDMRNCVHLLNEQADRIEELEAKAMKASNAAFLEKRRADEAEAKLAKAMAFIEDLEGYQWPLDVQAKRFLAELKGETDD
jgi:hypothetical protein